jgi:hypothetical protein
MDTLTDTKGPAGILRATGAHGKEEYRFYEFPSGNPSKCGERPGQIKAFLCSSRSSFEKRVPFDKLPTMALQEQFVQLTGRSAAEIGITIMK